MLIGMGIFFSQRVRGSLEAFGGGVDCHSTSKSKKKKLLRSWEHMCHINKAFPLCQHPFFLCANKGPTCSPPHLFFFLMSFLTRALFVRSMMIRPIQAHGRKPMLMNVVAQRLYSSRPMDQPSASEYTLFFHTHPQ